MGKGKVSALPLEMKESHYEFLLLESRKHSTPQQARRRIDILMLAKQGKSNSEISRQVGCTRQTVIGRRKRWEADYEKLLVYESGKEGKGVSDLELSRYLLSLLGDKPRGGAPKRITVTQEQLIIALACEKPEDHGLVMDSWTHEMLAKVAVAKQIVGTISSSQIGRILKKKPYPTA